MAFQYFDSDYSAFVSSLESHLQLAAFNSTPSKEIEGGQRLDSKSVLAWRSKTIGADAVEVRKLGVECGCGGEWRLTSFANYISQKNWSHK